MQHTSRKAATQSTVRGAQLSRFAGMLTLKGPVTTADDIHKYFFIVFFFFFFSENIKLDVSSESSARQRIHMKIKPYFL